MLPAKAAVLTWMLMTSKTTWAGRDDRCISPGLVLDSIMQEKRRTENGQTKSPQCTMERCIVVNFVAKLISKLNII